jgi:hypothetical protein
MAGSIPIESPPTDDPVLAEWLMRMMIQISAELSRANDMDPVSSMPGAFVEGMVRNFSIVIPPYISKIGPHIFINGSWVAMT